MTSNLAIQVRFLVAGPILALLTGCVGYNPNGPNRVCWQQLLYSGSMYMSVSCNPGDNYVVQNYPNNTNGIYVKEPQ